MSCHLVGQPGESFLHLFLACRLGGGGGRGEGGGSGLYENVFFLVLERDALV